MFYLPLERWIRNFINWYPHPREVPGGAVAILPGGGSFRVGLAGVALWHKHQPRKFVVSSGPEEADRIVKVLIDGGVPSRLIVVDHRATSTPENAAYSAALCSKKDRAGPCIILKQRFHLQRCRMNYSWFGFKNITLHPIDPPGTGLHHAPSEARKMVSNFLANLTGVTR